MRQQLSSVRLKSNLQRVSSKASTPENDPGDKPPPDDDDQPWEIYHYRPHIEVAGTLVYESEDRGIKHYDLESGYNLDVGTRRPLASGEITKIHESVQFVQQEKRRVRDIRAEQIERLVGTKPTTPKGPHPCVVKGAFLLMRVSTPHHRNGHLMLGTFPGMMSQKHVVKDIHHVPTLELNMDMEKANWKPDILTHLAIYTAGLAIGYETRGSNLRADNKSDWFTPEVLRAARVFLKQRQRLQLGLCRLRGVLHLRYHPLRRHEQFSRVHRVRPRFHLLWSSMSRIAIIHCIISGYYPGSRDTIYKALPYNLS